MKRTLFAAVTVVGAATALIVRAQPATGSVAGRITYAAGRPKPATLKVTKDQPVCGKKPMPDESLLVAGDGGLANAVVSVEGAAVAAPAPASARLDQDGCRFVPHVQAVPVGTKLDIGNGDPVLHNVHAKVTGKTLFNLALPLQHQKIPRKLDKAGLVTVGCDAGHTWMSAYLVVKPHGLIAVTGADGAFKIDGVPAGKYRVELWHEKLGAKVVPVEVAAGQQARVDVAW